MLHVNEDGVADLVLGFGTGADGYNIPAFVCDIYFAGQQPCLGGVLALATGGTGGSCGDCGQSTRYSVSRVR